MEAVVSEVRQAGKGADPGWVYVFKADGGFYKIGQSINPEGRLAKFSSLPFSIILIAKIGTDTMTLTERAYHRKYRHCRVAGEWFRLSEDELAELLADASWRGVYVPASAKNPDRWLGGRPKKERRGISVSLYLSPEMIDKAARIARTPREALLKALAEYDEGQSGSRVPVPRPKPPLRPKTVLPVENTACRRHRHLGMPPQDDCRDCYPLEIGT